MQSERRDATIGRFINVDPVQDGTNWYVYCNNNPLSFVDPTGLYENYPGGGKEGEEEYSGMHNEHDLNNIVKDFYNREKDAYNLKFGTKTEKDRYTDNACFARAQIMATYLKHIAEKIGDEKIVSIDFENVTIGGPKWNNHIVPRVTTENGDIYNVDPALSDKPLAYNSRKSRNEWYNAIKDSTSPKSRVIDSETSKENYYYKYIPETEKFDKARSGLDRYVESVDKDKTRGK